MTPRFDAYDASVLLRQCRHPFWPSLSNRTVNFMWRLLYYTLLVDFTRGKCAITSTPRSLWDLDVPLISWRASTCAAPHPIRTIAFLGARSGLVVPLAQHAAFLANSPQGLTSISFRRWFTTGAVWFFSRDVRLARQKNQIRYNEVRVLTIMFM
jgi:hypothetical protein